MSDPKTPYSRPQAVREYLAKPDHISEVGQSMTATEFMREWKPLSNEDKDELGMLAAAELGVELKALAKK